MKKIIHLYFLLFLFFINFFNTCFSTIFADVPSVSDSTLSELETCRALHQNLITTEVYAQLLILNDIYPTQRAAILSTIDHLKVLQDLQDPTIFYRFRSKLLRILASKTPAEDKEELIFTALAESEKEFLHETQARFGKYKPYESADTAATIGPPLLSDFTKNQDPRSITELQANTVYKFEFSRQSFDNKGLQRVIIDPAVLEFFQSNSITGPFTAQRWLSTFMMGYTTNIKGGSGLKRLRNVTGWLKEHDYWEIKLLKTMWRILVYRNDKGIWILEKALQKKELPK